MKCFNQKQQRIRTAAIGFLSLLLCAVLSVFAVGLFKTDDSLTANAVATSSTTINFGTDGINSSDATSMSKLFAALAGTTTATYADVYEKLDKNSSKVLNASNYTSSPTVTLGGIAFNIVYVSKAARDTTSSNKGAVNGKADDIIVTLYMAASNASYMSTWSKGIYSDTPNDKYPTNMYGASYIRNQLVGSPYLTAVGATSLSGTGAASSTWQPFSSTSGAFYNYLATPAQISWQQTLAGPQNGFTYNFPNDAYGTPASNNWYSSGKYNYGSLSTSDKTVYNSWQYDKIWLPSLSETGNSDTTGLWKTKAVQRQTGVSSGNAQYAWLRSGSTSSASNAYPLNSSGGYANLNVNYSYAVRPALHLNLKSAALAAGLPAGTTQEIAGPTFATSSGFTIDTAKTTATTTYSTSARTLNLSSATGVTVGLPSGWTRTGAAINVPAKAAVKNNYEITLTPADGYAWTGGDATAKKLTVSIGKATPTVSASLASGTYYIGRALSTVPVPTFTSGGVAGTIAWTNGTQTISSASFVAGWTFTPTDTASYNTVTGIVTVNAVPELDSLIITGAKQSYTAFESFVTDGLTVKAHYKANAKVDTELSASDYKLTLPYESESRTQFYYVDNGKNAVFSYTENGITKTYDLPITVARASVTGISFADSEVTYDGQLHTMAITGTLPEGVTVEYRISGSSNPFTGGTNVKSGGYAVTAHFTASATGNYAAPADMSATLTINARTLENGEVSGIEENYDYAGKPLTPEPSVSLILTEGGTLTTLVKGTDYDVTYSTSAYTVGTVVTVKVTGKGNYAGSVEKSFTIQKATLGFEVNEDENGYTYSGNPQGPTASFTNVAESDKERVKPTLTYKGRGSTVYAESAVKPTNAGTYTLVISIAGDDYPNYNHFASQEHEFEIKKAAPNVAVRYVSYNGTDDLYRGGTLPEIEIESAVYGDAEVAGTLSWKSANVLLLNTNDYTWQFVPDDAVNFETVTGVLTLTAVEPQIESIKAEWKGGTQPVIYASTKLSALRDKIIVTATLENGKTLVITEYSLTGSWGAEENPSVAGTYTLDFTRSGCPATLENVVYTAVLPEKLSIDAADDKEIKTEYNAEEEFDVSTIKVTVTYNDGSSKVVPAEQYSVVYRDGNSLCAGDVQVAIKYEEGGKTVTAQVSVNVSKLRYDVSEFKFTGENTGYDGNAHSAVFEGEFTIGTVSFTYDKKNADGEWETLEGVTSVTNVGEYRVTATFTITSDRDKLNYYAVSPMHAYITITKVDYAGVENIVFADKETVYNHGKPVEFEMNAENVPEGVTVTYEYETAEGGKDVSILPENIINAGVYIVNAYFAVDDNHNPIAMKTAVLTVKKADPATEPVLEGAELLVGTTLSNLRLVSGPDDDTAGKYAWDLDKNDHDHALVLGVNTLYYVFTPTDTANYNVVKRYMTINVAQKMLQSISVNAYMNGVKLYSSYSLEDFVALISDDKQDGFIRLVVVASFRDGKEMFEETLTKDQYQIYLLNGATTLTAGECCFGVKYTYEGVSKTNERASVEVIAVELASIEAEFTQNGKPVYSSNDVSAIKALLDDPDSGVTLVIRGTNNDGRECTEELSYTLSGDWSGVTASGNFNVTVTINGTTVSTTVPVYITLRELVGIEVEAFEQNGKPVYASNSFDTLEKLLNDASSGVTLTVKARYNDGDEVLVDLKNLTLTKEGTFGESAQVTVEFTDNGVTMEDTFEVTVTPVLVTGITVVRDDPDAKIYTDTSFVDLRNMITVTAHYNDGTEAETSDYSFSLPEGGDKLTAGEIIITLNYTGTDKDPSCAALPRPITVFKHETVIDLSGVQTEFTYNGEEQTVGGAVISDGDDGAVISYSANATFKDVPLGGRIVVTVSVSEGENYLAASSEITVTVNKAPLTVTAKDAHIFFGESPVNDGYEIAGFVGEETEAVLQGTIQYFYDYSQNGNAGSYSIAVGGLTSDNYEIEFVAGTLTVNKKPVDVVWDGLNAVYDGNTHKPSATFENIYGSSVGMEIEITDEAGDVVSSPVEAGKYSVTASVNNPNYEFNGAMQEFVIELAEISVKSSGDQWFDEQGLYTGEIILVSLDAVTESGAYKYISVKGGQEAGIKLEYSMGYLISEGSAPAPEDETGYSTNKPDNIIEAGRYIVNYRVSAPNHKDYYGQWKVEIVDIEDPEAHYVTVIFNRALEFTYGEIPESDEELTALAKKLVDENYITVSGALTAERLLEVAMLRLAVDNDNDVNSSTSVGNYTPYFVFRAEFEEEYGDYSIFYKNSNTSDNLNTDKVVIKQRVLDITLDKTSFIHDGTARMPVATVTDRTSGESAEVTLVAGITEYNVTLGERTVKLIVRIDGNVVEIGGYSINLSVDNTNYSVDNPFRSVFIVAEQHDEEPEGLSPLIIGIIAGVGALALIAVIVAIVAVRRKGAAAVPGQPGYFDDDGFNDDFEEYTDE